MAEITKIINFTSDKNLHELATVSVVEANDTLEVKEKELHLSNESNIQLLALRDELEDNFRKLAKMENKLKFEILSKSKEIESLQITVEFNLDIIKPI